MLLMVDGVFCLCARSLRSHAVPRRSEAESGAQFLSTRLMWKFIFSLSGYWAANTILPGITKLSFYTLCYRENAKTMTNR